ncbi:MAG: iron ABC transporter permease [Spirochaetes bacterium]|jgi:iron complex transport system permease protein|nr:iron ABC transporter permease [Spirochaetota bacterium]
MKNKKLKYTAIILLGISVILLSLSLGTTFISPAEILKIPGAEYNNEMQILLSLRIPRLVMTLIVGASLAVSGVLFQAILKNPLADPFTIGVSSGASLGACFGIIFLQSNNFILLGAFAGGIGASSLVYIISKLRRFGSSSLILAGISLSFILWAGVLLIFALSPSQQVHKALMWLMGDLSIARYNMLYRAVPLSLLVIIFSMIYHRHLNIIAFGDELAYSMGITARDIRNIFWLAAILAAISVSLAGIIGFVGLIIPHITRTLFGPDHKRLIFLSSVVGALFLAACDTLGRTIAPPYEVPIGVITGFIGGVFFLVLMIRKGGRE